MPRQRRLFLITKTECDTMFAEDWYTFPMNCMHANNRGDVHPYGSKYAYSVRSNGTVMDQALDLGHEEVYYLLLQLGQTHPHRFLEVGECQECKDGDCCRPSWFKLPPGHLHCEKVFKADVLEMERREVKKWHVKRDFDWDSEDECETPADPLHTHYTYVHSMTTADDLYTSDRHKAILSRNRNYTQTNSNAKGLSEIHRRQIRWKKRHWEVVCPKLSAPICAPVFPQGVHQLW